MDYYELAKEFASSMNGFKESIVKNFDENQRGEMFALNVISKSENGTSPSIISAKLRVSNPRVCAILKSLESKDYITREVDKNNRRNVIVRSTKKGDECASLNYEKAMNIYANILERLGEEDAIELVRITKKLCEVNDIE